MLVNPLFPPQYHTPSHPPITPPNTLQLMVDGMTFMICDSPDHISLSLMTDAASLDTPPSPITTPTPTAPTPPAVPPTVDLVFDQNALTSLIYGLSEYVAGSMGGGGAGRGWIPSDGMLQVRSGRTLQRARGYPHRLRLTSVERAGEDGVGEVRHKKDVLLTERYGGVGCLEITQNTQQMHTQSTHPKCTHRMYMQPIIHPPTPHYIPTHPTPTPHIPHHQPHPPLGSSGH